MSAGIQLNLPDCQFPHMHPCKGCWERTQSIQSQATVCSTVHDRDPSHSLTFWIQKYNWKLICQRETIVSKQFRERKIFDNQQSKMVHVIPCRDCAGAADKKNPTQYKGHHGGLDPVALGQTNEPGHKQCVHYLVWKGLVKGSCKCRRTKQSICSTTRRISRTFWEEVLRYCTWFFKGQFGNKNQSKLQQESFPNGKTPYYW